MNAVIDAHDEAVRARAKWSTLNSAHEGYGVVPWPGRAGRWRTR
jgi:hypothetical protein